MAYDTYGGELNILNVDASTIYESFISEIEEALGEKLYPGDERRLLCDAIASVLVVYLNKVNDAAKQSSLTYAAGEMLDALGARYGLTRITPVAATIQVRAALASGYTSVIIPAGTVVIANGTEFLTDSAVTLTSGNSPQTITATCALTGDAYNGLTADETASTANFPAGVTVTAYSDSTGGVTGEAYDYDGDDRFRERIRLAPSNFTNSGTEDVYISIAEATITGIKDCRCLWDPTGWQYLRYKYYAGLVNTITYPTLADWITYNETASGVKDGFVINPTLMFLVALRSGSDMSNAQKNSLLVALNDSDVRAITDAATLCDAIRQSYSISLTYYTSRANAEAVAEAVSDAVDEYAAWQGAKIGRSITPEKLTALVMNAGADRVTISSPAYTELNAWDIASLSGTATINAVYTD